MNILFSIEHPAHVHFFKYVIWELQKNKKNNIVVVAFDKDITIDLLNSFKIEHINLKSYGKSLLAKGFKMPFISLRLAYIGLKYKIDIFAGISIFAAQAAFLIRKKGYVFTDTEHATEQIALFKPFATKILTPQCFIKDLGKKHVRYDGFHELAYLHPNCFKPKLSVLEDLGLTKNDKFFVLRFVSWDASHDIGQKGISFNTKVKLIQLLKSHGKIIISSESELPSEFEEFRMNICSTKMHDLLSYATLFIGEGATMASECVMLGTPAVYVNSLNMGYLIEQEILGLLYSMRTDVGLIELVGQLLKENDLKNNRLKFLRKKRHFRIKKM